MLLTAVAAIPAPPLLADLSGHVIAISTGFTGAEVVLFGTTDGAGDVAVVVTGPPGTVAVRQKESLAGLWFNRQSVTFQGVPGYYAVATNRPLASLVQESVLERHQIGLDHLQLTPVGAVAQPRATLFRAALIRNKQAQGLYSTSLGQLSFLGERLFRTNLRFPANVPTGLYTVGVFLIRDGDVVSAQTTPLAVTKVGLSAEVADFAQRRPVLYGVAAVLGAVLAGWLAGALLRKP